MGHPEIKNLTPYSFENSFATDEEGRPTVIPIVKGTFDISPDGKLSVAEKQVPVNLAGENYGEPGKSSYKYEPEGGYPKPATDVVLIGHAQARGANVTQLRVHLQVGSLKKTVRVTGDRMRKRLFGFAYWTTSPKPFQKIPLIYERAFGGWDRSRQSQRWHSFEPRNPVGTGYRGWFGKFFDDVRLPNLERPGKTLQWYRRRPPPAGFGFTSPDWRPRYKLAGTYNKKWMKTRMPLLPKNFNRRFFNSASAGLIAKGFLKGNENVVIENATPSGLLRFNLPAVAPPTCYVQIHGSHVNAPVKTNLDTIIINTEDNKLFLFWRGSLVVRNGLQDIAEVLIQPDGMPAPVEFTKPDDEDVPEAESDLELEEVTA